MIFLIFSGLCCWNLKFFKNGPFVWFFQDNVAKFQGIFSLMHHFSIFSGLFGWNFIFSHVFLMEKFSDFFFSGLCGLSFRVLKNGPFFSSFQDYMADISGLFFFKKTTNFFFDFFSIILLNFQDFQKWTISLNFSGLCGLNIRVFLNKGPFSDFFRIIWLKFQVFSKMEFFSDFFRIMWQKNLFFKIPFFWSCQDMWLKFQIFQKRDHFSDFFQDHVAEISGSLKN